MVKLQQDHAMILEKVFRIFPISSSHRSGRSARQLRRIKRRCVLRKRTRTIYQTTDEPVSAFIQRVNHASMIRLESLLVNWTTKGRRENDEYVAINPTRADNKPGSFKVNLKTGVWCDFATGDAGGDPVSLYAYLNGLRQFEAARALANEVGVSK